MIHGIFYKRTPSRRPEKHLDTQKLLLNPKLESLVEYHLPHAWLAQAVDDIRLEFKQVGPYIVLAWARLDNPEIIQQTLKLDPNQAYSDTNLILHAYQAYGERCTDVLFGDFAFAIYHTEKHALFCARDQMGIKPFYYYDHEDFFVFSSSLALFHELPIVLLKPSQAWACKYLVANLSMDFEKTAYHKLFKLPPATAFTLSQKTPTLKRYFEFHTEKHPESNFEAYLEGYQAELERAIKTRVQTDHPLGSESSGGLDSSTTTAYGAKHYKGPISDFYTFGFAHAEEEPKRILSLSQSLGIPNNFISCDALHETPELATHALNILGAPCEHGNATFHNLFYQTAAKHQVRSLLSGFGGDEFVTTIHGDLYFHELFADKAYWKLLNSLPGHPLLRPLRFLKIAHQGYTLGGKKSLRMHQAMQTRWPHYLVSDKHAKTYALKAQFDDVARFDHGYKNLDQFTLEKRWVPFVSTRTESCTLMAASYGIDYRWPLLDARLIQYFLSVPSSAKIKHGMGRYLHREAVKKHVPSATNWNPSKYMGEVRTPHVKPMPLNPDLHPNVLTLIDTTKLKQQQEALKDIAYNARNMPDHLRTFSTNIKQVNALDNWLKRYHPEAFDWAEA